jgi:hypothetical protein
MKKLRSVRELRELLYWADDNGLTASQKEELEVEMLKAEAFECGELEEQQTNALDTFIDSFTWEQRKTNKFMYARDWFNGLVPADQEFALANIKTIYKKNNAETFRIGMVK